MEAHEEELGPIDIVVIGYAPDAPMTGEAVPLLLDLVDRGIVRVLDVLFVMQNEDGTFSQKGQTYGPYVDAGVRKRLVVENPPPAAPDGRIKFTDRWYLPGQPAMTFDPGYRD